MNDMQQLPFGRSANWPGKPFGRQNKDAGNLDLHAHDMNPPARSVGLENDYFLNRSGVVRDTQWTKPRAPSSTCFSSTETFIHEHDVSTESTLMAFSVWLMKGRSNSLVASA